jgi:APA family basic amino acid/polyamine antiporter
LDRVGAGTTDAPAPQLRRGLPLGALVALVVGNQLGTSLYTLPAAVATEAGPLGVIAWVIAAIGFWFIAETFAALGPRFPRTGGPYVFAEAAMGRFAGFETAWCYWLTAWVGNVAIATGLVAYLGWFFPAMDQSALLRFVVAQAMLWGCAWLNVRGVRESGRVQVALLVLNIVPFVLLAVALGHVRADNFQPFAPKGVGGLGAGVALIVWAFSGVESATVTAEEVDGDPTLIRRGTRIGFLIAAVMYVLAAVVVTGVLPTAEIAATARPLAAVLGRALGPWAYTAVATLGVVTAFACLNGWTMLLGRVPYSAAVDGVFPAFFARVHPRYGTPHVGLWVGTAFASAGLFTYFSQSLLQAFEKLVLVANFGILMAYLATAVSAVVLSARVGRITPEGDRVRMFAVGAGATAFIAWAILNVGVETIAWGSAVVALGVPMYILRMRAR